MVKSGALSIYIDIKPKRWRITQSYRALHALEQLSESTKLGYSDPGVHDGPGIRPHFILHIMFADKVDKIAYEESSPYYYLVRKLKRYSKRGGFKLIAS